MFTFEVDAESDVPLWVQLRQRLVYLIESGYFKPGDQLPTVRGLASEISINYNTVNKAYLSLASDGYIESTRGRGAFVRDIRSETGEEMFDEIDGVVDEFISSCRALGLDYDDIQRCVTQKLMRLKIKNASEVAAKRASSGTAAGAGQPGVGGEADGRGGARIVEVDMHPADKGAQTGA